MNKRKIDILLILGFPVLLSAGIVLIPVVTDYSSHELASVAVDKTTR